MVARNFAQDERASRIAGPINYHPLAGVSQSLKELQERHNVAARACQDPNIGECRRQPREKEESSNDGAPHQNLPMAVQQRGARGAVPTEVETLDYDHGCRTWDAAHIGLPIYLRPPGVTRFKDQAEP
jgi:hypothetical protein